MSFSVQYGEHVTRLTCSGGDELLLHLALPVLGGSASESWPMGVDCVAVTGAGSGSCCCAEPSAAVAAAASSGTAGAHWEQQQGWYVLHGADTLWACAVADAADTALEPATEALYRALFSLCEGWQLQRVWHYLPRINEPGTAGLERYRAFCRGRSLAFEATFGDGFHMHLPAASAVGCEGGQLVIYACARRNCSVHYFENPLQVPAYRYSQTYGPRAPGFARSSTAQVGSGAAACCEIYLSGTASIREERSQLAGGILGQLEVTVGNLNRIAAESGLGSFLPTLAGVCSAGLAEAKTVGGAVEAQGVGDAVRGAGGIDCGVQPEQSAGERRRFKVYLRHAADYPVVSTQFNALLRKEDEVLYVHSDICRAELDLEIEATVLVRSV